MTTSRIRVLNHMRAWLLTVGEPLPIDPDNPRLLRTGMLANTLVERGHDVVWWTSTFDHVARKNRFHENMCIRVRDRFAVRLIHGCEYKKNISLARIRNHRQVATAFRQLAAQSERPDVIHCSMPTIDLSLAAVQFGQQYGVPVLLDLRDLWPDIISDHVPPLLRGPARWATSSMRRDLKTACQGASGLVGMTEDFLQWGLRYAGRSMAASDRVVPLAYSGRVPSTEALQKAEKYWRQLGVGCDPDEFIICFFGNVSRRTELRDVIQAAKILQHKAPPCRFVLCGNGEDLANCQRLAADLSNVCLPGRIGAAEIWDLMRKSKLGIVPYLSTQDFVMSVPNKAIEYLSAGLPILTSLRGTLQDLVETQECGMRYENGNPAMLADKVGELCGDLRRVANMSQCAKRLFEERFVAERVYGDLAFHLENVAANRHMDFSTPLIRRVS